MLGIIVYMIGANGGIEAQGLNLGELHTLCRFA